MMEVCDRCGCALPRPDDMHLVGIVGVPLPTLCLCLRCWDIFDAVASGRAAQRFLDEAKPGIIRRRARSPLCPDCGNPLVEVDGMWTHAR